MAQQYRWLMEGLSIERQIQGQISALEKQVELLTEALYLSRHKRFGAVLERASEEVIDQLSLLFNEVEVYANKAAETDSGSVAVAAHKRIGTTAMPAGSVNRKALRRLW